MHHVSIKVYTFILIAMNNWEVLISYVLTL